MTHSKTSFLLLSILALGIGCGDDDSSVEMDAGGGVDAPAMEDAPVADPDAGPETLELVGGDWSMPAGEEGYVCVRHTVDRTMVVNEFRPIQPLGTHHTVVTLVPDPEAGTDGTTACAAFTNGPDMIYGSGVGTDPFAMPPRVAIKIEAGTQVLLNLHLFNSSTAAISGHSGIEVTLLPEEAVVHEAQVVLMGEEFFRIPARTMDHEIEGGCTMTGDTTVFAVMPHMHTFGTFMSVETGGSVSQILHEDFYSFDEQKYTTFEPLDLSSGDRINVLCRYDNPGDNVVNFGDSTLSEMCYAVVYRYPVVRSPGITCTL